MSTEILKVMAGAVKPSVAVWIWRRVQERIRPQAMRRTISGVLAKSRPGVRIAKASCWRRRHRDEEVGEAFGAERIRTMTGVAGDACIEDTWGMHKGQLPLIGRRLLVQFRFRSRRQSSVRRPSSRPRGTMTGVA